MKKKICVVLWALLMGATVFAASPKIASVPQWIKDCTCYMFHIFCGRPDIKVNELFTKINGYTKITRAEVSDDPKGTGYKVLAIDYENKKPGYTDNYMTLELLVNQKTNYAKLSKIKVDIPEANRTYFYEDDENGTSALSFFSSINHWFMDLESWE